MSDRTFTVIGKVLDYIAGVSSAICLVLLVVFAGFEITRDDAAAMLAVFHAIQLVFIGNILFHLVFRFRATLRSNRVVKWIVDILMLVTFVVWIHPHPGHPWLPWLYSRRFLLIVLAVYSVVDLSYNLSKIPGRRANPAVLMALSFLIFIIVGALLLMLPRCTFHGISFFDSLFVSSSAVCITGLSSVDIPSTFTPLGILVLAALVQLGSLGLITFTSFFAMFFAGNTSIYNQLILKDVIYSKSMNALVPTLLYVLGFTITVEAIGAVWVYFTIPPGLAMTGEERLLFACFHSMSSFCNAGFSTLPGGMSNPALLHSSQTIYIVTSVLVFAGAIGFPILVNFKEILRLKLKKLWLGLRHRRSDLIPLHTFDLNTKIVLCTTLGVLVVGSVGFFILEYDNSLAGMTLYEKVVQSVFNSMVPRSAGFASVNPATFLNATLMLVIVQMVIGGSSQSMAGGIKVNTLGVILLNLKSVVRGHEGVSAFHRTIDPASVRRANAVVVISAIALACYCLPLLILEPDLPSRSLIFEAVSALFTVGSSLGITADLSDASKALLSTAMFLGRVGLLSLLMGLVRHRVDRSTHYPTDAVIIN